MQDLILVAPELLVLLFACLVLLAATVGGDGERRLSFWLAQTGLLGGLGLVALSAGGSPGEAFSGTYVDDPMASALKAFVFAVVVLVFIYSREYLRQRDRLSGEYFALGLFAVLGMMVLVSAGSLLTVYLGLELLSLSLYAMVAMDRASGAAAEAAMKYFVLGAIASGMLLYGISIVYGVTGNLDLAAVSAAVHAEPGNRPLLVFGLAFVVIGIAFKLGAVPFHMWLPDVYEGAGTSTTLFIATAPKIAAFALAMRLLVDGLGGLVEDWSAMLAVLAALSIGLGNVVAIAQSNIKRMLAYSAIAHMGYLLLGVVAGTGDGYAAAMFYAIVYALMSAGAFGMVILLGRRGFEAERIADFQGLARRSPWFALMMLIVMFAMAGVPPFAGFWAKWFVIKEVVAAGAVWLGVLAVLFAVVGAYYYLRIVKLMYFDEPPGAPPPFVRDADLGLALSCNSLALLALGVAPGLLMSLCLVAMRV